MASASFSECAASQASLSDACCQISSGPPLGRIGSNLLPGLPIRQSRFHPSKNLGMAPSLAPPQSDRRGQTPHSIIPTQGTLRPLQQPRQAPYVHEEWQDSGITVLRGSSYHRPRLHQSPFLQPSVVLQKLFDLIGRVVSEVPPQERGSIRWPNTFLEPMLVGPDHIGPLLAIRLGSLRPSRALAFELWRPNSLRGAVSHCRSSGCSILGSRAPVWLQCGFVLSNFEQLLRPVLCWSRERKEEASNITRSLTVSIFPKSAHVCAVLSSTALAC